MRSFAKSAKTKKYDTVQHTLFTRQCNMEENMEKGLRRWFNKNIRVEYIQKSQEDPTKVGVYRIDPYTEGKFKGYHMRSLDIKKYGSKKMKEQLWKDLLFGVKEGTVLPEALVDATSK